MSEHGTSLSAPKVQPDQPQETAEAILTGLCHPASHPERHEATQVLEEEEQDKLRNSLQMTLLEPDMKRHTLPKTQDTDTAAVTKIAVDSQMRRVLSLPSNNKRKRSKSSDVVPLKRAKKEDICENLPQKGVEVTPPCDDPDGSHSHIIHAEDVIKVQQHNYKIQGLLGQGAYGRVAKCLDLTTDSHKMVAIKIGRATPEVDAIFKKEYSILKLLKDADPKCEHHCIQAKDFFPFQRHSCIVFPILGLSLYEFLKENDFRPFPRDHIWDFVGQLIDGVAFLHRSGLVHTDLKPENILLVNSESRKYSLPRKGQQTKYQKILDSTEIRLIDFGCVEFAKEKNATGLITTAQYRAPEVVLEMGWSYPADVFSLACLFAELHTGSMLLPCDMLNRFAVMERVLGPMPTSFRDKAREKKPGFFKQNKTVAWPDPDTSEELQLVIEKMKPLETVIPPKDNSNQRFLQMLKKMLTYDPEDRIRLEDALLCEYVRTKAPTHSQMYAKKWRAVS